MLWNRHWFGPMFDAPLTVETPHGSRIDVDITTDRRDLRHASAVLFHAPTLEDLPERRRRQPWVLLSMEANRNFPYQADPDVVRAFELTMTYRLDSDVPCPYGNRHQYGGFGSAQPFERPDSDAAACFIASNPLPGRDRFVAELMKHMPVASYGACLNNRSWEEVTATSTDRAETALAAIAAHPFYLAFENVRDYDYVTEKLYRPLSVGTIPVYWGATNIEDFVPSPDAAIVVDANTRPKTLAQQLMQLAGNPDALAAHLAWREQPAPRFAQLLDLGDVDSRARLATKVAHRCDRSCRCGGRLRRLA